MASRYWRCRRVSAGEVCGTLNLATKKKCHLCGKLRPKRKQPAHAMCLDFPYEWWAEAYGERCGICGAAPSATRRLDRDHDHKTGQPRGLLCHLCNRTLGNRVTLEWMRAAVAYLERVEEREAA